MQHSDDDGAGLVEIVVAMFALAIIAMAFLPLLISAAQQSDANSNRQTATSAVNARLDQLGNLSPTCGAVTGFRSAKPALPLPTGLSETITVGACPTSYPGTVSATVSVFGPTSTSVPLSTATTLIRVTSAS